MPNDGHSHAEASESEGSMKPTEVTPVLPQYSALRTFALACQVFNGNFLDKTEAVKASPALCQSLYSPTSWFISECQSIVGL